MFITRNDAIKTLIEEYTKRATVDKETARKTLIKEGVYSEEGKLRKEYGGSE